MWYCVSLHVSNNTTKERNIWIPALDPSSKEFSIAWPHWSSLSLSFSLSLSLSLFVSQEYQEKHQHSQFASSKINTSAFFENSIVSFPPKTEGRKVSSPSLLGSWPPHHRLLPASGFFSSQWRMPRYSLVASWRVTPATVNKVGGPRNPSNLHMLKWFEIEQLFRVFFVDMSWFKIEIFDIISCKPPCCSF